MQVHPDMDDRAVLLAARTGDRDAFAVLVTRYESVAFRAAYLIVRDAAGAEDIAQEAFVRVHRSWPRFNTDEPFRPWLVRIVTNLALNEVRARGRRAGFLARFGRVPLERPPEPEGLALASEAQRLLWRAMNELPPGDRVVLYLRYWLELPEKEIALAIGKAPGTVKSRLFRAGRRLREIVERDFPSLRPEDIPAGEAHG
jgi:RNA polymerase sigma-70 factor (ECF subfamily)